MPRSRLRRGRGASLAALQIERAATLTGALVYHEVAPQLVLMPYLQRVVNGTGFIDREYGLRRGRIDLQLRWPYQDASGRRRWQREAIEINVWRDQKPDPLDDGLFQLDAYLGQLGLDRGVLMIFDRRAAHSTAAGAGDAGASPPITFEAARTASAAGQRPRRHRATRVRSPQGAVPGEQLIRYARPPRHGTRGTSCRATHCRPPCGR